MFDLRVDDAPEPIVELKRLIRLQRAYGHANHGDELMTEKKVEEALEEYKAAAALAPEILELPFWHAVTLASIGREAEAAPIFKAVFAKEPVWADLCRACLRRDCSQTIRRSSHAFEPALKKR